MKYYDVSIDDAMVLDRDGSVWIWSPVAKRWDYISQAGGTSGWDSREYLPEEYEPYTRINEAARIVIRKGLQ